MPPFHHFANVCDGGGSHLDAVRPHVCDQPLSCAASLNSSSCLSHTCDTGAHHFPGNSGKTMSKAALHLHIPHVAPMCFDRAGEAESAPIEKRT